MGQVLVWLRVRSLQLSVEVWVSAGVPIAADS